MITKIYVDLDGVLADFDGYFETTFGIKSTDVSDEELWGLINKYDEDGNCWFLDLPKMKDADVLMSFLNNLRGVNIYILTAISERHDNFSERSLQKKIWASEKFKINKKNIFVVGKSERKGEFADEDSVLIDDSTRSTNAFTDGGGTSILHKNARDTIYKLKLMFNNAGIV